MNNWISVTIANKPPEDTKANYFCNPGWCSIPVLGFERSGIIAVVTYEIDEDGKENWYTHDSEKWNVTKDITHWMPLPNIP